MKTAKRLQGPSAKPRRVPLGTAFTIIELLVVLSITAMLITLLLPAISKARETSYRVRCMSNVRQIGTGFNVYGADFKNNWPAIMTSDPKLTLPANSTWGGFESNILETALAPYTNIQADQAQTQAGGQIYLCPSSPVRVVPVPGTLKRIYARFDGVPQDATHNNYTGLFYNFWEGVVDPYQDPVNWGNYPNTYRLDWFTKPVGVPIQWCSQRNPASPTWNTLGARSWHGLGNRPTVFADGHAKNLTNAFYSGDYQDILIGKNVPEHELIWPASSNFNWSNGGNFCLSEY